MHCLFLCKLTLWKSLPIAVVKIASEAFGVQVGEKSSLILETFWPAVWYLQEGVNDFQDICCDLVAFYRFATFWTINHFLYF